MKSNYGWTDDKTKIQTIEGFLSPAEAECLYGLARNANGIIVEIGSWKGKSTVCLALGSRGKQEARKVFAIDPHLGLVENGFDTSNTERTFRENISRMGCNDVVVPLVMTSERAALDWKESISLLWIDGAHDYENAAKDFSLWQPHVKERGVIAFHDAIYSAGHNYSGVRKVIVESILNSNEFDDIHFCNSVVFATKMRNASRKAKCVKMAKLVEFQVLPFAFMIAAGLVLILAKTHLLTPARTLRSRLGKKTATPR